MQVTHIRRRKVHVGESLESPAVLLKSGLCWFSQYAGARQTRYEGWFLTDTSTLPHGMIKILDRVSLLSHEEEVPSALRVAKDQAIFEYGKEKLTIALTENGMSITSSGPSIVLTFDIRGIYQWPESQRMFTYACDAKGTLIGYTDPLLGKLVYTYVLGAFICQEDGEWHDTVHPRDAARNSSPTNGWVMRVPTTSTYLALGIALDPITARNRAFASLGTAIPVVDTYEKVDARFMTSLCAADTLEQLKAPGGYYAGLPWFHQFWSRDELIAGLGLPETEQLTMIEHYLSLPLDKGQLPTFAGSGTSCADGAGWLALLIQEYGFTKLSKELQAECISFFAHAVRELEAHRMHENGLIYSGHNATWMDTIGRTGYRLEIQAMYALMLSLIDSPKREAFLKTARKAFWKEGFLLDGINDDGTPDLFARPNVFIAYLLAPDLLKKEDWEECFTNTITELKTPKNGLSSVSPKAPFYLGLSTGENNHSYHQGDEWFFVNGLAATALFRFDKKGSLRDFADKLLKRGIEETLGQNYLGCVGEIASASTGESWGCGIQAFSAGGWLMADKEKRSRR